MVTFIEIIDGAAVGSRFQVVEGVTIGRAKADIVIKDPKASGTHAKVTLDSKGQLVLVDLESSNGLHINGHRVKKVALLPGVMFEVGRTLFKVITVEDVAAIDFSRIMTWRKALASLGEKLPTNLRSPEPALQTFSPPLRLNFIQGIQTDEEYVLGYGPRQAGAETLDIELLDNEAPREAFELHPTPGAVEIRILSPRVTLNQKSLTKEILKDGDLISIGTTLIKVSYL